MGRFETTVPFYVRSRPRYPQDLFSVVAKTLKMIGTERLLDLGTGPGLLALGFAPFVAEVIGVDPEPAMLVAARDAAAASGLAARWIAGRAEDLDVAALERFDVVTIGRALHWMDPAPTRAVLDRLVTVGGSVVTCAASSASDGRNPWLAAFNAVRAGWSTGSPALDQADRDAFFAPTRFRRTATLSVDAEHRIAISDLVARVFSMSSTAPAVLGEAQTAVADTVMAVLTPYAVNGTILDIVTATADVFTSS